jgi:hypothetical protein
MMDNDDTPSLRDTGPIPRNAFEHNISERVSSLEDSRKTLRWILGLGAPALFSAMVVIVLYSADKIASNSERVGATAAKIDALGEQIKGLEHEIEELRHVLLKFSGIEPARPISIVGAP